MLPDMTFLYFAFKSQSQSNVVRIRYETLNMRLKAYFSTSPQLKPMEMICSPSIFSPQYVYFGQINAALLCQAIAVFKILLNVLNLVTF